ncbi:MAG: hypothetical protein ACK4PR_13845 [Gammaproteobacteria bacterium]
MNNITIPAREELFDVASKLYLNITESDIDLYLKVLAKNIQLNCQKKTRMKLQYAMSD